MKEEIIFKYLEGELDEKERVEVEKKFSKEIEFYKKLIEISGSLPKYEVPQEVWTEIKSKIWGRKRNLLAASIILSLIVGGVLYSFLMKVDLENKTKEREVETVVRSWERSLKEFEYFEKSHPEYSNLLKEAKRKIITRGERTLQALEASWRRQ